MAVTKQQKILGGVLALGLCAVGADQLFLQGGGPTAANAAAATTLPAGPASGTDADGTGTRPDTKPGLDVLAGHAELADRLSDLAQTRALSADSMRQAFAPDTAWVRQDASVGRGDPPDPQDRFTDVYTLEAVMASADGDAAVVNGRLLKVGQKLSGFTLVEVTMQTPEAKGAATFYYDGRTLTLELDDDR